MTDEITEPTVRLCWNDYAIRGAVQALRAAHLDIMADDVERHLKPAVEEPEEFGSIVRARYPGNETDWFLWQKTPMHGKHYWESEHGAVDVWSELTDVEVLRVGIGGEYNHTLQQVRDLLFRSPCGTLTHEEAATAYKFLLKGLSDILADTPQSGDGAAAPPAAGTAAESATATAAPSPAASWRNGYEQATKHTRERIYNRVARLKPQLITAVEKTAIDKALAEIEKDADDTVTGRGIPS